MSQQQDCDVAHTVLVVLGMAFDITRHCTVKHAAALHMHGLKRPHAEQCMRYVYALSLPILSVRTINLNVSEPHDLLITNSLPLAGFLLKPVNR